MTKVTTSLWSSLPIPALILDPENRVCDVNPAAELFLNSSKKHLTGHLLWDKVVVNAPLEDVAGRVRSGRAPLFLNGLDVGSNTRRPVSCDLQLAPLMDRPDHILLLVESRELVGRLDRSLSSKTAARSAIGMAEMLAHEIKNPLAGITGAAQLISMNASEDDLELTNLIVAECRRILKLLSQVEDFGNVRPPDRKPVNLHDILDRARQSASLGFASGMKFAEEYDPSLPLSMADPDQLLQVFLNLLRNATEASDQGGTIRIRTFYEQTLRVERKDGTRSSVPLQVEIIDDGPGIPPDIADDLFEPFVSGRENGTGLGLALVAKIIADHEGWISTDSVPGRTAIRVSLPRAPRDLPHHE